MKTNSTPRPSSLARLIELVLSWDENAPANVAPFTGANDKHQIAASTSGNVSDILEKLPARVNKRAKAG